MKNIITFVLLLIIGLCVNNFGQSTYYLGTGSPSNAVNTCYMCHSSNVYDEWKDTRHAIAQDSMTSTFFGYSCLSCHNTGWDKSVANYGADEYVDSTAGDGYTITDATNFDRVKNVGCENCHGPLGTSTRTLDNTAHFSAVNTPRYGADVCGKCHDGSHHPTYSEWQASKHDEFPSFIPNWTDRSQSGACYRCHHAQDFVAWLDDPNYDPLTFVPDGDLANVTCVACHDPHNSTNPGQLRLPISGSQVICDKCHTVETQTVNIYETPHHPTAECLTGSSNFGFRYPGQTYTNSVHTFVATERCINCHVNNEGTGDFGSATGHTFYPRVISCAGASCHGTNYYTAPGVDTSNVDLQFNYKNAQHKTDSLLNVLQQKLVIVDPLLLHDIAKGEDYNAALYNYEAVMNEGSRGVHNTALSQKLLVDAIANFNPGSVENEGGIPTQFNLSQNYPNPFNPSTEIKFAIPEAGNVKITIYDALGEEIVTLVNEYMNAGNYSTKWNAVNLSTGIYLYKMESKNFDQVKKMVLVK